MQREQIGKVAAHAQKDPQRGGHGREELGDHGPGRAIDAASRVRSIPEVTTHIVYMVERLCTVQIRILHPPQGPDSISKVRVRIGCK
jgi:hypothetical protein